LNALAKLISQEQGKTTAPNRQRNNRIGVYIPSTSATCSVIIFYCIAVV